jgi:hypothetical protein
MPFRVHSRDLMLLKNIINDSVIIRAINLVMESLYSAIKLLTDSSNNVEVNELLFKDPDSKLFLLDLVSLKQITGIEGIDPNTVCMAVDDFHSLCRMVFYCHISEINYNNRDRHSLDSTIRVLIFISGIEDIPKGVWKSNKTSL